MVTKRNTRPCAATNSKGVACSMPPLKGGRFCYVHDPASAAKRAISRRQGESLRQIVPNAKTPVDVSSISALREHIGKALADALMHPNVLKRAAIVGRLVQVAARLIEDGE